MQKKCIIFIKTDLLLPEERLNELREYIAHLDFTKVQSFDEFAYSYANNKIEIIHHPINQNTLNYDLIFNKISSGCILTDLNNLKKILSL